MGILDRDFYIQLSLGNVPKCSVFERFGRNPDVDAAEDIWGSGGVYSGFPTGAAEKLEVLSSSANDTAAGTGARTVEISGLLDANGNLLDPVRVTLNGTTPVALDATQTYSRMSQLRVLTAGSGGGNAGTLTVRHVVTTANIFSVLPIGLNRTSLAFYTVPAGHKLLINRLFSSMAISTGSAGSASLSFLARPSGGVFEQYLPVEITNSKSLDICCLPYFIVFEALTDIKWRAQSVGQANTIIDVGFGGTLVKLET